MPNRVALQNVQNRQAVTRLAEIYLHSAPDQILRRPLGTPVQDLGSHALTYQFPSIQELITIYYKGTSTTFSLGGLDSSAGPYPLYQVFAGEGISSNYVRGSGLQDTHFPIMINNLATVEVLFQLDLNPSTPTIRVEALQDAVSSVETISISVLSGFWGEGFLYFNQHETSSPAQAVPEYNAFGEPVTIASGLQSFETMREVFAGTTW